MNSAASARKEIECTWNVAEFLASLEGCVGTANKMRKARNVILERMIAKLR